MKKLIISLTVLCAIAWGCSDSPTLPEPEQPQMVADARFHTVDEAIEIAKTTMQSCYPEQNSRAERTASAGNVITKYRNNSRSEQPEPLYYVVNFDHEQGYAIVPARKIKESALAAVPVGNLNEETENNGLKAFLSLTETYLEAQSQTTNYPIDVDIDTTTHIREPGLIMKDRVDTIYLFHCDPLVAQQWEQDDFYGEFCPNWRTGCVPLAVATAATHLNFRFGEPDTRIDFNFVGRIYAYEIFNWKEIHKHYRSEFYYGGKFYEEICYARDKEYTHNAISSLCRQIGKDAHSEYSPMNPYGTGTAESEIIPVLRKYVSSKLTVENIKTYDPTQVSHYIDRGIIIINANERDFEYGGHTFIGDGYHIGAFTKTETVYDDVKHKWVIKKSDFNQCLIHFRWGYRGIDDGYFSGTVFTANNSVYDEPRFIAVYQK